MDRGYIKVDELYRTSVHHIPALGDVISLGYIRVRIRSLRTCRRWKESSWPSGWQGRTSGR